MTAKRKNRNARFGRSGGTQPVRSIVTIPTPGEPDTSKVRGFYAEGVVWSRVVTHRAETAL